MRRPASTRSWPVRPVGILLLAGLLLVGLPTYAQTITVTSAVPDTADQGTLGLVVAIGGDGFARGSKVDFFVTGTTNPGGIAVKNVKYKNPKALEATIDVAPDAQTDLKFDIQVTSGSRTGKGTELFKVVVKVTGGDTTPPGTVTDLQTSEVGFNTAVLTWTAPADDGYLPASGPAVKYDVRVRKGWSAETPDCGPYTVPAWTDALYDDPCYVAHATHAAGTPGGTETARIEFLAPETEYWAMVRTLDDATPTGSWSVLADDLGYQASFVTGPFPPPPATTPWAAGIVDICHDSDGCASYSLSSPRFDFDPTGNPSMIYAKNRVPMLASWTGTGWQVETAGVPIDTSNGAYDFAFDPYGIASIATFANSGLRFYRRLGETSEPWATETVASGWIRWVRLRFNPVGSVPTIAYVFRKGSRDSLRLAERRDGVWTNQDVVSNAWRTEGLAFDRQGNPAVTFLQEVNGVNRIGFALRVAGTWKVEFPDAGPGAPWNGASSATTAFDPVRGDFSGAWEFNDAVSCCVHLVRFCERTAGAWTCKPLAEGDTIGPFPLLAIAEDGATYVSYSSQATLLVAVRRPLEEAWTHEFADWNAFGGWRDLRLGPDGQPGVAYNGALDELGLRPYEPVCFARRTPQ